MKRHHRYCCAKQARNDNRINGRRRDGNSYKRNKRRREAHAEHDRKRYEQAHIPSLKAKRYVYECKNCKHSASNNGVAYVPFRKIAYRAFLMELQIEIHVI